MFRIIFPFLWLLDSSVGAEQKGNIRILIDMMSAANTTLKGAVNDDCCPSKGDFRPARAHCLAGRCVSQKGWLSVLRRAGRTIHHQIIPWIFQGHLY
jgi:hypothetical protein